MLLRSSSTPVLGSLLSSISESPNNNSSHHESPLKHHLPPPSPIHHCSSGSGSGSKLSCGSFNLPTVSCNSSPISPSIADFSAGSHKGIRRAQSEGNLQGLAYASCKEEDFYNANQPSKKSSGRNKCLMLETIPSFSYCTLKGRREEDEEESDLEDEEDIQDYFEENGEEEDCLEENNEESLQSCLKNEKMSMLLIEEMQRLDNMWKVDLEGFAGQEMYLAKGLGIGGRGGSRGGGGEFNPAGGDNGDKQEIEEYYKKMVDENPGNPLFLRNYAHFLYKSKRDLERAEDYYSRAILADPGDGEVLSQYAMLIWELHRDEDRATSYFQRAVHASPEDSHVHAAYASFLWETEEDDDECDAPSDLDSITHRIHRTALASANA
ncbi:Tetratricopeptide repeat (TPR)-like superfamily protein [Melia azedarach]|uniref:Tetratricopeptide repeat (TPR)-like superfamily protein n=1 Tax=Melia azedarach TaxID=155640 RepID=A0ACC1YXE1_MELAZ|nr:Tetratricopeptide repeat (TPR)-like superfamily protein [Melia azedarach]